MAAEATPALLWTPLAWLPDGWRSNVVLRARSSARASGHSPAVMYVPRPISSWIA